MRYIPRIRAQIFIEAQSNSARAVKNSLEIMARDISREKSFEVSDISLEDPIELGNDMYSSALELTASFPDLRTMVEFCLKYGPTHVEVLEPMWLELEKIRILSTLEICLNWIRKISSQKGKKLILYLNNEYKRHKESDEVVEEVPPILSEEEELRVQLVYPMSEFENEEQGVNLIEKIVRSHGMVITKKKSSITKEKGKKVLLVAIEGIFDDFSKFFELVMRSLPIGVRIVNPSKIKLGIGDLQSIINELCNTIHEIFSTDIVERS